jgi:RNA polymerase sigma-70 factor (ECF subfamily)
MSRDTDRERARRAMDRYADGDDSAFAELYDVLEPHLLGFAMHLARHRPRAEDLVQQTFLQLHRSRARWVRGARVFPYAFSIAHHHFIDSTHREKYEQLVSTETLEPEEPPSGAPWADDELDGKRRLATVLEQLHLLPEHHRMAFQLVVLEELSIAEAAEVLGLSPGNIRVQVHRAREALRQLQDPSPALPTAVAGEILTKPGGPLD